MQTDANRSDQDSANTTSHPIFENDYCLVTADGVLKQKDASFFTGKVLEEGLSTAPEAHIANYTDAFIKLKVDTEHELNQLPADLSPAQLDDARQALLNKLKNAEAIGDFDALAEQIHETLAQKAATPKVQETAEDAPRDLALSEDAAEAEKIVEAKAEKPEESPESPAETDPEAYYKELTEQAKKLSEEKNIKQAMAYYEELKKQWSAGPEFSENAYYKLKDSFDAVSTDLETRWQEYQKKQEERRQKNLAYRDELLEKIQAIIDKKKWSAQGEINKLTRKFENVKPLPESGPEAQEEKLRELTKIFDENRVQYLVEVRQQEEDNLMGKLYVLDKAEALINEAGAQTEDWNALDAELEKLFKQWKKIGRVPKEKEAELWERYNNARESFFEKRVDEDPEFKKEMNKNIEKRLSLIARAEELASAESLSKAAREINQLHGEWKKLSNIPQAQHDELWAQFKKASDAFNKIRDENSDQIRREEAENLEAKEALIAEAEALVEEEGWKGNAKKMEELFQRWKEIGPVPRRKSNPIWRRFRKLMDSFYKNRRKHFKEVRSEQQENLSQKREIVDRIKELAQAEDIEEALLEVKELQNKYKEIGFVPIKQKDKIWKQYREACDVFFGELRKRGAKASGKPGGSTPARAGAKEGSSQEKQLNSDIFRLRKEIDQLRGEILKYADSKTYFKPNKRGQKLIDEIQGNIDEAEKKLAAKEQEIREIEQKLHDLKHPPQQNEDSAGETQDS
ncbi:MAG: DUF349 domain-containing protein [Cyclonatronaceae bacterium]